MKASCPWLDRQLSGRKLCLLLLLVGLAQTLDSLCANGDDMRQHLLVVYNKNAPESERLARYYAEKRQVAADHILGIDCPDLEEIDRPTYNDKIRAPIDAYLLNQGWLTRSPTVLAPGPKNISLQIATRNDIWAIALIRGVPLRIQNDPQINDVLHLKPELITNGASVDSELATLPTSGLPLNGPTLNPYYFCGYARPFDALDARRQVLVARLDAPTPAEVERMINESLNAEANRLTGSACIDARGISDKNNPYSLGEDWLRNTRSAFNRDGWPVEFDNAANPIPANRPLTQVALYAGWYAQDAQGPFFHPPRRFATGAVAYHLHSFSATTLRSRTSGWAGPLVSAGAAATMGCVYEPYLDLTPHVDIFFERLLAGYTFAEAATMSQKGLSWMVTIVGDPLYRPFGLNIPQALAQARAQNSLSLEWLELQQVRIAHQRSPLSQSALRQKLITPRATEISWEGYADLLTESGNPVDLDQAVSAYRQALKIAFTPVDQIRLGLKAARAAAKNGQPLSARDTLKELIDRWPHEVIFYGLATDSTPPEVPNSAP